MHSIPTEQIANERESFACFGHALFSLPVLANIAALVSITPVAAQEHLNPAEPLATPRTTQEVESLRTNKANHATDTSGGVTGNDDLARDSQPTPSDSNIANQTISLGEGAMPQENRNSEPPAAEADIGGNLSGISTISDDATAYSNATVPGTPILQETSNDTAGPSSEPVDIPSSLKDPALALTQLIARTERQADLPHGLSPWGQHLARQP